MGLLTNRYDTISGINKSMQDQAFGWGRMSQPKYAGMAASAGLQGDMAGRGLGMMLGGQDPLMQKQDLIDEIMRKHPDPKTPEELEAVANDLQAAGLTDLAMEVRGVANATKTANAATTKANAPKADLYKNLGSALSTQVLSTKFMNSYFSYLGEDNLVKPYNRKDGHYDTYTAYKDERGRHQGDLENLFAQWSNSKKYDGTTKDELATLMNDDAAMTKDFLEWIGHHGNVELSNFMTQAILGGTDGTEDGGLGVVEGYKAKVDEDDHMVITARTQFAKWGIEDVDRMMTVLNKIEHKTPFQTMQWELLKERKAQIQKEDKENSASNDAESSSMAAGAGVNSWFMPD